MNRKRGFFNRAISSPFPRILLSAGVASVLTVALAQLAMVHFAPAESIVRPFGIAGFVFGNIHQGSALISYGALGASLFGLVLIGLTLLSSRDRVSPERP